VIPLTAKPVPLSPSVRGQMAVYMAHADFRCPGSTIHGVDVHANAMAASTPCPLCKRELGDYVRALDVVAWP
jgi:hypothetical protein